MLFDTIYRTRRKIVQCFDQERERYQKEGQKGLLLSFLDPGSPGPSEDFILKGPACLGETVTSGVSLGLPRKLLPERNVVIYLIEFDEFKEELERRRWDEELTSFEEGNIDVAIVKEFYANLYDPEEKSPKQVRVRGHLIKFYEDALNTFLKTPVIIEEGETLPAYSRFAFLTPDPQELAAKLCIPGRGFELNADGYLISHQTFITAQHDSSRLGFPALITALCKARGVTSDSRSLESLSPAINLAYIKKNCWNLDDPIVTFRGPRKARGKRSEAPPTSAAPDAYAPSSSTLPYPTTAAPSSSTAAPSVPAPSLHRGQVIIMQSLQSSGLPSIMSTDEFLAQVAWPGVQPSPSGGGEASAAQEPVPAKEPMPDAEDEPVPPEPFIFETDPVAQDDAAAQEPTSPVHISPAPIPEDS
ncbi:hypothetical protein HKD37_19G053236 [Glycine soja]